jgi:hypothetical protein
MKRAAVALLAVALLADGPRPALSQGLPLPIEVQIPLLIKTATFDRRRQAEPGSRIVVAILYQGRFRASKDNASAVREALSGLPASVLGGFSLSVVSIDLDKTADPTDLLRRSHAAVAYVCELRALDPNTIMHVPRELGILSVTGVPRYVEEGLSVGADLRGNRAQLVINLTAARAEGADLPAQVLKLARIVD